MAKKKKLSFAKRADKIMKSFKDRNDPISKRTMNEQLEILKSEQEASREEMMKNQNPEGPKMDGSGQGMRLGMDQRQMAYGGPFEPENTAANFFREEELPNYEMNYDDPRLDDIKLEDEYTENDMNGMYGYEKTMANLDTLWNGKNGDGGISSAPGKIGEGIQNGYNSMGDHDKELLAKSLPYMFRKNDSKRPEVGRFEGINSDSLVGRERMAGELAKGKVTAGDLQRRELMAKYAGGDANKLARMMMASGNQTNRSLANITDQKNASDLQNRKLEAQQRGQYALYNNQGENNYRDQIAMATNAKSDYDRKFKEDQFKSMTNIQKEFFDNKRAEKYTDAERSAMIAIAEKEGISLENAERKLRRSKQGQDYNKNNKLYIDPNRYATTV